MVLSCFGHILEFHFTVIEKVIPRSFRWWCIVVICLGEQIWAIRLFISYDSSLPLGQCFSVPWLSVLKASMNCIYSWYLFIFLWFSLYYCFWKPLYKYNFSIILTITSSSSHPPSWTQKKIFEVFFNSLIS